VNTDIDLKALMHALADGEVSSAEREEAQALMAQNPHLQAEYETALIVRSLLHRSCRPITDEESWAQSRQRIADLARVRQTESFVGRYAWGIAGAFLVLITAAATVNRMDRSQPLYTGDVARLTSSMSPVAFTRPAERANADQWLHKACGKALVDLTGEGVVATAGASAIVDGRPVARVDLRDADGPMTLIAVGSVNTVDGTGPSDTDELCRHKVGEMNCVSWKDGDYAVLLIGPRDHDQLARIASSIRVSP